MMRKLIVDGMLHGTGIRNLDTGGYILPEELNLDNVLIKKIKEWLSQYEEEHYNNYLNEENVKDLDRIGIAIAGLIQKLCPNDRIGYYSDAKLMELSMTTAENCINKPDIISTSDQPHETEESETETMQNTDDRSRLQD